MGRKKKVTFDDIAKYTHFSKTTISRYFNNPDSLTLENQEIISNALAELNYQENKVARILANGKTEFIGIIIPNLYHHFYSEILNQILSTYEEFGYKFLLFIGNDQEEKERRYIQELMAYQIEGMIILSTTIPSAELAGLQIPIVTIEREDQHVCSVNTDNYMGGFQAASLLVKRGCEILILIASPTPENMPAYGRIQGFLDICSQHQLNHQIIIEDMGITHESVENHMRGIFERIEETWPGKKKGIFFSNDTLANVFLNQIIRRYGTLPDEYRLVGFDNSASSREAVIPISTIGQHVDKLAREAVSLLVDLMNERKKRRPHPLEAPIHKTITPVLIPRETTEGIKKTK